MANSLTFSAGSFMQCTVSTASRGTNVVFDILSATSSTDRRVYGLSVVNADNGANPVKIWLNDGTAEYQIFNANVVANSGNASGTALTDIFSSTMGESLLAKTRDYNGVTYLNLPKNWSIRLSYSAGPAAGEAFYTFVFGEYY